VADGIKGAPANTSPWKDIAVIKAPYAPPKERVVLRSPDESFDQAMAAYHKDDFVVAAAQLDALNELEPDNAVEVKFYLGVSLLLVGRNQDAISPLRQVTQLSIGPLQESSRYYLALAYLKSDYKDQAVNELDTVIKMKGQFRSAAEELRRQISASVR
jgi:predicted Zn-dependent protease